MIAELDAFSFYVNQPHFFHNKPLNLSLPKIPFLNRYVHDTIPINDIRRTN